MLLSHTHDIGGIVADLKRDRLAISPNDPKIAVLQRARDDRSVAPKRSTILRIFALEPSEHGGEIFRCGLLHIHIVTSSARDRRSAIRRRRRRLGSAPAPAASPAPRFAPGSPRTVRARARFRSAA